MKVPRLGFALGHQRIQTTTPPSKAGAIFRARKVLEEIVYDTVALEGNPFTFPEVKTLMDGITVGGRRIEDAEQVLNQARAWRELIARVERRTFSLERATFEALHAHVAREEALEWGSLRTGAVRIAGTTHEPPDAETLPARMETAIETIGTMEEVHHKAIAAFLWTARNQPFWDGNKRTGRLMMNGILLEHGHDILTVAAAKRVEFDEKMIRFYDSANGAEMLRFMAGCSLDPNVKCKAGGMREPRERDGEGDAPSPADRAMREALEHESDGYVPLHKREGGTRTTVDSGEKPRTETARGAGPKTGQGDGKLRPPDDSGTLGY